MFYDGTKYFYQLNLQGDVIGIIDTTGASVAKYAYDAWGRVVYSTGSMAAINPIRYRGYYYDAELGMYYLQSRYYDPTLKRFINADSYASTGQSFMGHNSFLYCNNNPTNKSDASGTLPGRVTDYDCILKYFGTYWNYYQYRNKYEVPSGYGNNYGGVSSFKNKDGSYSIYDNQRQHPDSIFHEQTFVINTSGTTFSANSGMPTYVSARAELITGGWEFEHIDLSIFDFGIASGSLGFGDNGFKASGEVTIWQPSISIDIKDVTIELGVKAGTLGSSREIWGEKIEIGGNTPLFGAYISISW